VAAFPDIFAAAQGGMLGLPGTNRVAREVAMTDLQRERVIDQWLDQALALGPGERASFLARLAIEDPELHLRLARLIADAERSDGFLDRPALRARADADPPRQSPDAGSTFGPYRLVSRLGAGGMGEVWRAERITGGFEQQVAIKLMRPDAGASRARFEAERDILASLGHPSIARLYDGGVSADGRPYMVMEYVEGLDLSSWCRQHRAELPQRLALFLAVCDAVAYAHAQLVVHRDLKPANVLVNGAGEVKLLDFGIAKLLQPDAIGDATRTAHLSPAYAAPEQLTGGRIGTAADVHALGATLYEILTGRLPWPIQALPLGLAVERLLHQTPPPPSSVVAPDDAVPSRALRGDLDAIVAKALRSEPSARYPDARALGDDIRRYLAHEPVSARSGARWYVARRYLRRNWPAVSAATFLAMVIAGSAVYADLARRETMTALTRADAVREFVVGLFEANDPVARGGKVLSARELVDIGALRLESGLDADPDTRIELLGVIGDLYRGVGDNTRAAELRRRRLDLAERAYDRGDVRRIEAQIDVATTELDAERFDAAERVLMAALTAVGSADHDVRARILAHFGGLAFQRGRYSDAENYVDQALALYARLPNSDPVDRAEVMAGKATMQFAAGHIAESEQLLREAHTLALAHEARRPGSLIHIRQSLAKTLTGLGQFDEAKRLTEADIDTITRLYGAGHPRLADDVYQLGSIARIRGDNEQALAHYERALGMYRESYGPEHSYVASTLTTMGNALANAGRSVEAIEALTQAQSIYAATLGADHLHVGVAAITLGNARVGAGDIAGAEREFRAALATFERIGSADHPYAGAARMGLAEALAEGGRCEEALGLARQARERLAAEFGLADFRVLDAGRTLVRCLLVLQRADEARAVVEESERAFANSADAGERARSRIAALRSLLDQQAVPAQTR
jgi:serine/threonine-protein kinase